MTAACVFPFLSSSGFIANHVHLVTPEWKTLFEHLADSAVSGLLITALIFAAIAFFLEKITAALQRVVARDSKSFLTTLLGVGVFVRSMYLTAFSNSPWSDQLWYHQRAVQMAEGFGYIGNDGRPTAYYPAGYPAFLAMVYRILGADPEAAKYMNVALGIATIAIVYWGTKKYFNRRVAAVAAIIMTASLSQIAYADTLFSEITFSFVFVAAIFLSLKLLSGGQNETAAFASWGVLLGIACLIRPVAIILAPAMVVALWREKRSLRNFAMPFAAAMVCFILVLAPNAIRNYKVFHAIVPISTNGGIDFQIGNNPNSRGHYMGMPDIPEGVSEAGASTRGYREGLSWIAWHPFDAFVNEGRKLFYLYARDDEGTLFSMSNIPDVTLWAMAIPVFVFTDLGYYCILALAIAYVWRKRRSLSQNEYFFAAVWVLTTLFYLAFFGSDRFHFPLYAIFCVFAAKAVEEM